MENIVHRLVGDGGGHAGAAGWSGTCDEVELKSVLLATLIIGVDRMKDVREILSDLNSGSIIYQISQTN